MTTKEGEEEYKRGTIKLKGSIPKEKTCSEGTKDTKHVKQKIK